MPKPFRWPFLPPASRDSWPQLTSAGVVLPPGAARTGRRAQWLLSRKLCRFRRFVVPVQAGAQGRVVLRNLLLAWSPFDSSDYRVVLRGETAWAWAWDRSVVATLLPDTRSGVTVLPETLLVEPARSSLPRLVRCLEGVEGQVWRGNDLLASRWWAQTPPADEWQQWCRASGAQDPIDSAAPSPALSEPNWLGSPWAEGVKVEQLLSSGSHLESVALGAALVALVGLSAVQMRQAWAAHSEHKERLTERDRLAATAAPVTLARDKALALGIEAENLSKQLVALQPLDVMLHLSERLPARGVTLKEFELVQPRLRIALDVNADVARTAIVKDLQAAGWFQQVTEVRDTAGRGWVWFEMQVQGTSPPPGPTDGAARAAAALVGAARPNTAASTGAGLGLPAGPGASGPGASAPGVRP
jgi:hypothetical protein